MLAVFRQMREDALANQKELAWACHNSLERGNPVLTFKGMDCRRV